MEALQNTQKRVQWIDIFRCICIIAIVLGHALGAKPTQASPLVIYLYSFHVPAFFFISGTLFKTGDRFLPFLKKKAGSLLVPYFTFGTLSILIFFIAGATVASSLSISISSTELLPNIGGMIYGNGVNGYMKWNLPLWFLPCLFAASLLMYGIQKLISRSSNQSATTIIFLITAFALAYLNYYVLKITNLPFSFENVIYMLPFMIAGRYIGIKEIKLTNKTIKILLALIFIVLGMFLSLLSVPRVDYVCSFYKNLTIFYLSAAFSVAGFILLTQSFTSKTAASIGRNTLPILVMHKFPVVFLQLLLVKYMTSPVINILIVILITFLSIILCLLAGKIIRMLFPFALGERKI